MADMLADGASMLADALSEHVSQTVTIRRGSLSTTGVKASKGAPLTEVDTQFGVLRIVGTPWIIKASQYAFSGVPATPEKNDTIEESDGAVWQVLPLDDSQEARHSDPFGYSWRIHTKRTTVPD
jgi:hypothetical protein